MLRRAFLTGLISTLAAPMVVKAEILMPIKAIIKPIFFLSPGVTIREVDYTFRVDPDYDQVGEMYFHNEKTFQEFSALLKEDIQRHINKPSFMRTLLTSGSKENLRLAKIKEQGFVPVHTTNKTLDTHGNSTSTIGSGDSESRNLDAREEIDNSY